MDLQSPNKDNVDLGDLLVLEGFKGGIKVMPITALEEKQIIAESHDSPSSSPYDLAIVLKKDGAYLVGESIVREYLP